MRLGVRGAKLAAAAGARRLRALAHRIDDPVEDLLLVGLDGLDARMKAHRRQGLLSVPGRRAACVRRRILRRLRQTAEGVSDEAIGEVGDEAAHGPARGSPVGGPRIRRRC